MTECRCTTDASRRVVRGNDFSVSVRVTRLVTRDGLSQREDIGLGGCTDIKASMVSRMGKRTALECSVTEDRLVVDFDETLSCGVYGLEVSGKDSAGADWRAFLKPGEFLEIVEASSDAYTPGGDQPEIVMSAAPSTVSTETIGKIDDAIKAAAEATATVDGKADKADTLAGYGITDAYTKDETLSKEEIEELRSEAVESFAPKSAIPTAVSQLSNDAGYLTEHQDISGKADKGTTLADYGITDSYTKTEADTLLAGKVDTTDSRLSDARPASDVQAWAKAAEKPSYTKDEVGLGNVDNTSDADKPISSATQAALDGKVDKTDAVAYYETVKTIEE